MVTDATQRVGRFSTPGAQSGVEAGYRDINSDPLNKKFIRRNIKPYKTLRKFSKPGGLRKLKGMDYSQFEKLAARAVLTKAGVKQKKLDTSVKGEYPKRQITRAKQALNRVGENYLGQIQNKRLRRTAKAIRQVRRNKRVMETNIWSGKGYDLYKGYKGARPPRGR